MRFRYFFCCKRHEEENIIKDARNLFRLEKLKKETIDTTIKDMEISLN